MEKIIDKIIDLDVLGILEVLEVLEILEIYRGSGDSRGSRYI